ncbi:MAG TPA: D-2-hydroxyacid dehydrogenase [Chthoniobacteraceae bacterium]|nr:D-2-hydroxyacid dehydrogenase [Chthoniobacteraceae bacterium]
MNPLRIYVDLGMTPDVREVLERGTTGHELVFPKVPISSVLVKAERDPQFRSADVAFGQPDLQAISEAAQLKWVHVSSSGITRYDTPEFRAQMAQRGISVSNSARVYNEACATHVLGFMLAQARCLPWALKSRAANGSDSWVSLRNSCTPLRAQTVLILGYGAIGKRLAEMLRPFDVEIIAHRRKPRGDEGVAVITDEGLPEVLSRADHVLNILPDSSSTRHFFNAERFELLKPGAVFYNIGRGGTVDQDALLTTLRSGRIKAAWLDVTEPEPLPNDHPLWAEPNCFITPHIAGGHADETLTLVQHFLENFDRFVRGEPLVDCVI